MGKGKKIKSSKGDPTIGGSTIPLEKQIEQSRLVRPRNALRLKDRTIKKRSQELDPNRFVSGDLGAKILKEARKQKRLVEGLMKEEEGEDAEGSNSNEEKPNGSHGARTGGQINLGGASSSLGAPGKRSDDDEEDSEHDDSTADYDDGPVILNAEDERALERFMCRDTQKQKTLYDVIQEKIQQKQLEVASQFSDADNMTMQVRQLDPKLVDMYKSVGLVLSRYRAGKIPKAFKIIPKMVNWEQILQLTEPDRWTAAAIYQATRLFASNLNQKMCQRFYNLILLPRLRDDIDEYKKLNFHLYQALRKSLYKSAAFFKGILLPLCESGDCTLREATIIGSVLTKCSIPMLHSAAALLKIAEMEYSGANSLFIRLLIDKKYTLPFRVVDGLVFHFLRFATDKREMTVLWHQALLSFCQRYKADMSAEQRDNLLELIKTHTHYQMTPEIRRELEHAQSRDVEDDSHIPPDVDME